MKFKIIALALIQAFWAMDCVCAGADELRNNSANNQKSILSPEVNISSAPFQRACFNIYTKRVSSSLNSESTDFGLFQKKSVSGYSTIKDLIIGLYEGVNFNGNGKKLNVAEIMNSEEESLKKIVLKYLTDYQKGKCEIKSNEIDDLFLERLLKTTVCDNKPVSIYANRIFNKLDERFSNSLKEKKIEDLKKSFNQERGFAGCFYPVNEEFIIKWMENGENIGLVKQRIRSLGRKFGKYNITPEEINIYVNEVRSDLWENYSLFRPEKGNFYRFLDYRIIAVMTRIERQEGANGRDISYRDETNGEIKNRTEKLSKEGRRPDLDTIIRLAKNEEIEELTRGFTPKQREVFLLRHFGYKCREIATLLSITFQAVAERLSYLKRNLDFNKDIKLYGTGKAIEIMEEEKELKQKKWRIKKQMIKQMESLLTGEGIETSKITFSALVGKGGTIYLCSLNINGERAPIYLTSLSSYKKREVVVEVMPEGKDGWHMLTLYEEKENNRIQIANGRISYRDGLFYQKWDGKSETNAGLSWKNWFKNGLKEDEIPQDELERKIIWLQSSKMSVVKLPGNLTLTVPSEYKNGEAGVRVKSKLEDGFLLAIRLLENGNVISHNQIYMDESQTPRTRRINGFSLVSEFEVRIEGKSDNLTKIDFIEQAI